MSESVKLLYVRFTVLDIYSIRLLRMIIDVLVEIKYNFVKY